MMITIHGLPIGTKYHDLKVLIKQQCSISDFILDSLVSDTDGTKKVRVGLADDTEGSHLIKCLDGYRMSGNILRLVPVGKSCSTTQPPNTFDIRGNYQHAEYQNQNFHDRNSRPLDAARPDAWANNQWSSNQTQMQMQSSYNYQQPIVTAYGQPPNPLAKPQFEPREVVPLGRVPQQAQNFAYNPKSNLISLGPSNLREVPEASSRPTPPGRYPNQNYDSSSDKPITIMKENFQGPNQYNLTSSHNQSSNFQMQNAPSPWVNQHQQQKPFEKPVAPIDKKPYSDRKYQETSKPDDSYRYDKSGRELSPQRRGFRDVETVRRMSPSRQLTHSSRRVSPSGRQYTDRRSSPERRISPSNRNISSSGRHFSPGRQISPSGRHIPPSGRHVLPSSRPSGRHVSPPGQPSGRHVSPPGRASGRYVSPSGRQVSPPGRPSGRHVSPPGRPSGRHVSPPGRPSGRHVSPPGRPSGRQISPHERHLGPPGRNSSPPDRHGHLSSGRYSSPGRHVPPPGRPISPPGRHISSGRHVSPPGRSVVPTGRHVSPPGHHIPSTGRHSPLRRHISPSGRQIEIERKMSPLRKLSPQRRDSPQIRKEEYIRGRRTSPLTHSPMDRRPNPQTSERDLARPAHGRHESPRRQTRFSPSRRHADKQADYQDRPSSSVKDVRPAYEPPTQASNEAIYSGGYRPNVREEAAKYQSRSDHWNEREKFPSKVDDRREGSRMQKFDIPRASEQQRPSEQESNRSRSPKRDRSPVRDRYKRHSPSPRSPRRSWALEKRRSPEIREPPPPPVWPQEREEYTQQVRSKFPDRTFEKNSPVWETREIKRDDFQSNEDRRNFPEQRRKEIGKWKPIPSSSPPPNTSALRFEEPKITRKDFETRRDFTHDDDNRKGHPDRHEKEYRRERSDTRFKPELDGKDEVPRKRDEYSGRIEEKKKEILLKQEQLQKEIDEVYKRAVDFAKKAEMYRKGENKDESNYDDGRHRNDRQNPKEMQRHKREPYEDDRERGDYRRDKKSIRDEDAKKTDFDDFKRPRHISEDIHKAQMLIQIRIKRNKAVDEISEKIMTKHGNFLSGEVKKRVMDELKWTLGRKMQNMFGDNDVSFIEMVVKFNAKHSPKDEENIFNEVMSSLPNHFRNLKRSTQDDSDIPAKSSRRSPEPSSNKDLQSRATEQNKRPLSHRETLKKSSSSASEKRKSTEDPKSSESKPKKNSDNDSKQKQENEQLEEDQVEGQFQLNDLMARMLEEELQTIMIEVWQALPDAPSTEAEKFVAEKLKNETSDHIRNVIGLNVTKRLLNVYNPLIVKLRFTRRPESGCLTKFLKSYNIKSFKRIAEEANTFAARLASITDFDKICMEKEIRCGGAKIIVTPCYKFDKCPSKLITIYNNNYDEESKEEGKEHNDSENKEIEPNTINVKDSNTENEKNKDNETKIKDVSSENKEKANVSDKTISAIVENKISTTKDTAKVQKSTINKVKSNKEVQKTIDKTVNVKTIDRKTTGTVKAVSSNKPKVEDVKKKKATEEPKKPVTAKKAIESNKLIKNSSNSEKPKVPQTKKKIIIQEEQHIIDEEKEVMEDEIKKFDESEEMNDEEILALVSEGVVVDECSGSDEE